MTGKLHMPGFRERIGRGAAADGSRAGAAAGGQNGNDDFLGGGGGAAGVAGEDSRSHAGAGFPSAIMQPLPLASRYAGAPKPDQLHPPASALGSTWIRRFLPSSDHAESGELPPAGGGGDQMAVDLKPPIIRRGGGFGTAAIPPPLLLQLALDELKGGEDDVAEMAVDGGRDTSAKVSGNDHYVLKGKALLDRGPTYENTTMDRHGLKAGDLQSAHHRKASSMLNQPRNLVTAEGSSRLQDEGNPNHGGGLSTRGESQGNGLGVPIVTGFGSLRVVRKPPMGDYKKAVGSNPKLKAPVPEWGAEADLPARENLNRLSNARVPDLKFSGAQEMASEYSTKCTAVSMATLLKESNVWGEAGRPSRTVEFSGAWGFLKAKQKGIAADGDRSGISRSDRAKETPALFGQPPQDEPPARPKPFGEDHMAHRHKSWYQKFVDTGGDAPDEPGRTEFEDWFVPASAQANMGKDDGSRAHSRPPAVAKQTAGDEGRGKGLENRKMKEVVGGGFPAGRRHADGGPSSQQQHQQRHSQGVAPFGAPHQFQGDTNCIGKVGQPLPFAPHSSFPGEDGRPNKSGEDERNSLLTPLFAAAPQPRQQEGMDGGTAGQVGRNPPQWTSLFAAYNAPGHLQPTNSTSSTPTLRPDVHSRLQNGATPAINQPGEDLDVGGNPEDGRGGRSRGDEQEANVAPLASSLRGEARSHFDNPSSQFASSPWPDNESHNPNDDAGSGPYDSQATGSGYHSQASRVANRTAVGSNGEYLGTHHFETGATREVSEDVARSRDPSVSRTQELENRAGCQGKDARRPPISNEEDQAHGSTRPLRYQSTSWAQKDDTSASSPPSRPSYYNSSSDIGSPALPMRMVDAQLINRAVEAGSGKEGAQFMRWSHEHGNASAGFDLGRRKGSDLPVHESRGDRDHGHSGPLLGKDMDACNAQSTVRDIHREGDGRPGRPNDPGEAGLKLGKLRMSGEAMGEVGSSKRTRYDLNLDSKDSTSKMEGPGFSSREQGGGSTVKPSIWLQRWMPTSSAGKPPTGFSRPRENGWIGLAANVPRVSNTFIGSSGGRGTQINVASAIIGKRVEEGNSTRGRKNLIDRSAERGVFGLPPFPTPSAAAIALVGTAARKVGPLPQQRRGSLSKWPSVHFQTPQGPESERTSQSSEPLYIEQS